jgi:hypothetical protein
VLLRLRQWSDSQPGKVSQLEISPDAGSDDGRLAAYLSQVKGPLPWIVLSRARADGKAIVLWSGPLPDSAEAVIAKVGEVVK